MRHPQLQSLPEFSNNVPSPAIVFGFVGFIDHPDDPHLSVVQLGERLHEAYSSGVYVQVFRNQQREAARHTIWQLLDANRDGVISGDEKNAARIILYGHSWGGSTVVSLARELERDNIPVLLTVQVDSIHKLGGNDAKIPGNVREAANFYQPRGFFHGRKRIVAADPARTRILGNFRFVYEKNSVRCPSFSRIEMYFARPHLEMHCDPTVWKEVESLIRERLPQSG
jgi:hypothetical protein